MTLWSHFHNTVYFHHAKIQFHIPKWFNDIYVYAISCIQFHRIVMCPLELNFKKYGH